MRREGSSEGKANPEVKKRASAVVRYVERVLGRQTEKPDPAMIADIKEYYASIPVRDRANILYEKLMAYETDRRAAVNSIPKKDRAAALFDKVPGKAGERKAGPVEDLAESFTNSNLLADIKFLIEDEQTRAVFSETFADARFDARSYRMSDLGKTWKHLNEEISRLENEFHQVEQALFLETIEGSSNVSAAKSKAARLVRRLLDRKQQRENLMTLELEKVSKTAENTDVAAAFQFDTLKKYREQLKAGFVWLPSRRQIHADLVASLQNGRWPCLIGETGTGKSDQADAAALELTGSLPTEIQCTPTTGEKDIISDSEPDPEDGKKLRVVYKPLMQAFTGFDGPWQKVPSHSRGRIARFDEFGRLGARAYSAIKLAGQKKRGDVFNGHPVLPGAGVILTTNPPGIRYRDRTVPDTAMRREFAEIYVDYPDQSAENPEQYEFMLAALLDRNDHISVPEKELAPAYVRRDFADDKRETLPDGRVVVGEDVLIENGADREHGTLWRLANAVKAVQNSFIYGNMLPDEIPDNAPRFDDADGEIRLGSTTGEILTLSSTTITLGEVESWMKGYRDRSEKENKAFQVKTFSDWIKLKIGIYLKQVDQADRAKATAIFAHYGLLEKAPDLTDAKPITPKRIGYLSPRVPRPLHVEMPVVEAVEEPPTPEAEARPPELYTTVEVSLSNGETVRILKGNHSLRTRLSPALAVNGKTRFRVNDQDYSFAGALEEGGKPVGSLLGEPALHDVFTPEQVEVGKIDFEIARLERDVQSFCALTFEK